VINFLYQDHGIEDIREISSLKLNVNRKPNVSNNTEGLGRR
jgi:hypothetical protein